jgi:hypothetical protein
MALSRLSIPVKSFNVQACKLQDWTFLGEVSVGMASMFHFLHEVLLIFIGSPTTSAKPASAPGAPFDWEHSLSSRITGLTPEHSQALVSAQEHGACAHSMLLSTNKH